MFGPPFIITFVLPGFVIGNAGPIGFKFFAFVSLDIEAKKVVVTETALFAFEVAGFLHALGHHKFGVTDTGRFDRIVHGLHFRLVNFLGKSLECTGY